MAIWDLKSTAPGGISAIVLMASLAIARRSADGSPLLLSYECAGLAKDLDSKNNNTPPPAKKSSPPDTSAAAWNVIKSWSGSGIKETEFFSVGSTEWRISWSSRNEARPGTGLLQVYVKDANGKVVSIAANKQGPGQDVSYIHSPSGRYYVMINSANIDWAVRVETRN
jgi:hypothetical protein